MMLMHKVDPQVELLPKVTPDLKQDMLDTGQQEILRKARVLLDISSIVSHSNKGSG